jgi:hypothetical protein
MPAPGSTNYDFPCIAAEYEPHSLPRYRDSVLISAINSTFPQTEKELRAKLNKIPVFNDELRQLDPSMRRLQLAEMLRFRVATPALFSTISNIHGFMLESYVGREPYSVLAARRLEQTYKHMENNTYPSLSETGAQFSSAIFGMPGCGKTLAVDTAEELYQPRAPVIHHELYGIWQIPFLKLRMPFLGSSRVSLATALIRAIAMLFPPGDYEKLYLRSKLNSNQVILQAFALMQIHKVGFVVIDEGQGDPRLAGDAAVKAAERLDPTALTTTVVAGSNQSGVPLMVVGTRELEDILSSRMTLIRRTTGAGYEPLERAATRSKVSDFDRIFVIMWARQVVDIPLQLTARWKSIFYFYSRGVPDIFVKLFVAVQQRALDDKIASITEVLVHDVAKEELRALCSIGVALSSTEHPGALRFLWKKKDVRPLWVDWELYAATEAKKQLNASSAWSFEQAIEGFKKKLGNEGNTSSVPPSTASASAEPQTAPEQGAGALAPQSPGKARIPNEKRPVRSKAGSGQARTGASAVGKTASQPKAQKKTNAHAKRYMKPSAEDVSYTKWQDPDSVK